jgi:predicted secreted acid phosphatase
MVVVFDIDGTIADIEHRLHFIKDKNTDWDAFFKAAEFDGVIGPVLMLLWNLQANKNNDIVFITGRDEAIREITKKWLRSRGISVSDDKLLMRKHGDHRPDYIVKLELAAPFLNDIDIVFEDRASVVRAWRRAGVTCCQVADGDF